jgi:L-ascorbate metabolism protein UlaG (beta-lactamase superfamily)
MKENGNTLPSMKVRYLGHFCVEIIGYRHILIDPDFTIEPESGIEYICITRGHKDHIGRLTEIRTGVVVASPDVCQIVEKMGISHHRLRPIRSGEQIANIVALPGYSQAQGLIYTFLPLLLNRMKLVPATIPLSFLIKDEANLLHFSIPQKAPSNVQPDILCLPWRRVPLFTNLYENMVVRIAKQFHAPYVIPLLREISFSTADSFELGRRLEATLLNEKRWYLFHQHQLKKN